LFSLIRLKQSLLSFVGQAVAKAKDKAAKSAGKEQ
jgi:hypothetical protein